QAGVASAAVVARSVGGSGGLRLVGYVGARGGAVLDGAVVRAGVGRGLPDHMGPAGGVVLGRLPLKPNGQVDPGALAGPGFWLGLAYRGPRTPHEELLCGLFAELLHLPRVGIDDNFFELGGDSIVSIQLVSRARRGGVLLTPRLVFQHQTVAALAAAAGAVRSE